LFGDLAILTWLISGRHLGNHLGKVTTLSGLVLGDVSILMGMIPGLLFGKVSILSGIALDYMTILSRIMLGLTQDDVVAAAVVAHHPFEGGDLVVAQRHAALEGRRDGLGRGPTAVLQSGRALLVG
jgi:hypothetical protein